MRRARFIVLFTVLAICCCAPSVLAFSGQTNPATTTLSCLAPQSNIERVLEFHRHQPGTSNSSPSVASAPDPKATQSKVGRIEQLARALREQWHIQLTPAALQGEIDRIVRDSRAPAVLQDLFNALDDDPSVIANCVARPLLVERLVRDAYATDRTLHASQWEAIRRFEQSAASPRDALQNGAEVSLCMIAKDEDTQPACRPLAAFDPIFERTEHLRSSVGDDAEALIARWDLSTDSSERVIAVWKRRSFDDWWVANSDRFPMRDETIPGRYSIGSAQATCTDDTWSPTAGGVPTGREGAHAVWTGTEMLVWSGTDGGGFPESLSGGRYNPSTDSWKATRLDGTTPSGRKWFAAVWTGTEYIIWGGYNSWVSNYMDSGARYSPTTDSWTPTSAIGAPSGRSKHSAVWSGTEMIVWGGRDDLVTNGLNTGGRYNPLTDSWAPTSTGANVPGIRFDHVAVWTGGRMIVWGGNAGANPEVSVNTGGIYNPTTDTWLPMGTAGSVPLARCQATAVWIGSEMIIWGGNAGDLQLGGVVGTGARYKLSTGTWTALPIGGSAPSGRRLHSAVWTGTEMIIYGGLPGTTGATNTGARYKPSTDTWTWVSTSGLAPGPRRDHVAVWTGNRMIVWGGSDGVGSPLLNTGGRYDPVTNSWVPTTLGSGILSPRMLHTAVWTGSEMIIWGGAGVGTFNTGGRYQPATDSWTPTSMTGVPAARFRHTAVWTGFEMIIWGGSGTSPQLSTGGRYNPSSDTWIPTSTVNAPAARSYHQAIWTGSEMIVWGGAGPTYMNTGGRYSPSFDQWTSMSTTGAPEGRSDFSIVWTGNELLVWGGSGASSSRLDTGGRYSPVTNTWTPTSQVGAPTARQQHATSWTGSRMLVWSGLDVSNPVAGALTGASYSPASDTWQPIVPDASTPSPRALASSNWSGNEWIVWSGGPIAPYGQLTSGGRYSPASGTWRPTSQTPQPPIARENHTGVFTGDSIIVWGGWFANSIGDELHDTGGVYCANVCNPPVGVPSLFATRTGATTQLTWTSVGGAVRYDVVYGSVGALRSSGGDFAAGTSDCLASNSAALTVGEAITTPSPGDGIWYLVRATECRNGSYDDLGGSQVGNRDLEIAASGQDCQ